MSNPTSSVARPGPVLHGLFPLVWEPCPDEPGEHARRAVDEANITTLRNCLLLDSRAHDALEDREQVTPEIQRLEQRMNLVIDLLAHVLSRELQLPTPVSCEVSRDAVVWTGESLPAAGERVKLSLYLNPQYPRPLILYGKIDSPETRADGQFVRLVLSELPELVAEGLDRLIFRDHRRRVAQTKRGK